MTAHQSSGVKSYSQVQSSHDRLLHIALGEDFSESALRTGMMDLERVQKELQAELSVIQRAKQGINAHLTGGAKVSDGLALQDGINILVSRMQSHYGVCYSPMEARRGMKMFMGEGKQAGYGFWNNERGWTTLDEATVFQTGVNDPVATQFDQSGEEVILMSLDQARRHVEQAKIKLKAEREGQGSREALSKQMRSVCTRLLELGFERIVLRYDGAKREMAHEMGFGTLSLDDPQLRKDTRELALGLMLLTLPEVEFEKNQSIRFNTKLLSLERYNGGDAPDQLLFCADSDVEKPSSSIPRPRVRG